MGAGPDPFGTLHRLGGQVPDATRTALDRAAGLPGDIDLAAELETMARRFAIGPLFLVHEVDELRARTILDALALVDGIDHRVTLRACPFVERGTLLVITPEARAAAHDVGLTDDLLANPQEGHA